MVTGIMYPWGQTDLEFLVEKILNRSDPKEEAATPRGAPERGLPERKGRTTEPDRRSPWR